MNPLSNQFPIHIRTYAGLEDVLSREIAAMGGAEVKILNRAVECLGDWGFVYKLNLGLRTALRVLVPLHHFRFFGNDSFRQELQTIAWEDWFHVDQTFAIDSIVFSHMFNNSMFVSQLAKDGIADRFREKTGKRPYVDSREPDIAISIYVKENEASVYLDTSGDSLHRRGYRTEQVKAPLSEVMAAGIIRLSGWTPHFPFIDPMCGSGTFSIEAALAGAGVPAGIFREQFPFMRYRNFDRELWQKVLDSLTSKISDFPLDIRASDRSHHALRIARENASRAEVQTDIHFEVADFTKSKGPGKKAFVFINPPYGERLQPADLDSLYQQIGATLKHQYAGCEAYVFSSHPDLIKLIGLKPSKKWKLYNGKLECLLVQYSLYEGSRKPSKQAKEN